jgi:hypothetical protein
MSDIPLTANYNSKCYFDTDKCVCGLQHGSGRNAVPCSETDTTAERYTACELTVLATEAVSRTQHRADFLAFLRQARGSQVTWMLHFRFKTIITSCPYVLTWFKDTKLCKKVKVKLSP